MPELPGKKVAGLKAGDEAVKKATGKEWKDWFSILNKAGASKLSHKEIVALLKKNKVSPWWQQMIAVQYEIETGLREKHQKPDGYQISRSKTIDLSIDYLYQSFHDPLKRKKWLKDPDITITTANKNKSIRGKWSKDQILIEVYLYEKTPLKTQVVIQNNKIPSAAKAEKLKSYWKEALGKLSGQEK